MSDTLPGMACLSRILFRILSRPSAPAPASPRRVRHRFRAATLAVLALTALTLSPHPAWGWGRMGHRLVASLAETELTPAARAEVSRLLEGEAEPTLAGVAAWADDLRSNDPGLGRRSSPWHYVNLGEEQCVYQAGRDCKGGNCVVGAIAAQAVVLGDKDRPLAERAEALKFVVHFVGDVHQPLHAGYASDKGGNSVQVSIGGKGTNLHSLWDGKLLDTAGLDEAAYLAHLRVLPVVVPLPAAVLPPDGANWAQQACTLAMQPGFYPAAAKLPADYATTWRPVAEEQLRRAGTQLALLLNALLDR